MFIIVYHGRRGQLTLVEGRPAFFTSDKEAAQWYSVERGDPRQSPAVFEVILDVKKPARFKDLKDAIRKTGATKKDVKRYSPYEGENEVDFLYVPHVRQTERI